MKNFYLICLVIGSIFFVSTGSSVALDNKFKDWLKLVRSDALLSGVSESTLDQAFSDVKLVPRIIELDQNQPEGRQTFTEYLRRVVPETRIEAAQKRLTEHRVLLGQVGNYYQLQPRFLIALWGIESDFGRFTGGFSVINALTTLAYDGRRSKFFRAELIDALRILDKGDIELSSMTGSWAGAMGQSQFMPSSYRRFAVDYDQDGRRDIWATHADIFASMANYLHQSNWQYDQTWGREILLPDNFDLTLVGMEKTKPIGDWQRLGVRRIDGRDLPARQLDASIILPDGTNGNAFMVYHNFRVILNWNRSTYFALAVGILADRVLGR
ncbi:MAG: Membrane-bound lytic murein transglycosylase B [Alphaproteobacteria bacterium MarineAlpha9_Bin6]|nr:MAG: Membrane-bound lytic murein transglycosylase B [Alphaproteobacteria bacterium MarineAlpha9_Bin6]